MGILLALFLVYAVLVGLGITKSFKRHRDNKKIQVIDDFEYENDDFDWTTGGYVKIQPSTENQSHGKKCAEVTFLLADQFYPTPTPGAAWDPQMILDTESVTKLSVYEWQDFANLDMDVFNPQTQPVSWRVQVADSRSFVYETTGVLTPKKVSNISIPLDELIDKRLDLSNIRSLKFALDTTGASQPVTAYLDYVRLEGDAALAKKK